MSVIRFDISRQFFYENVVRREATTTSVASHTGQATAAAVLALLSFLAWPSALSWLGLPLFPGLAFDVKL